MSGQVRAMAAAPLLVVALGLALAPPSRADLLYVETPGLRVVYYDPGEAHLVPHATQSLLSGLEAEKRQLAYVPDGQVNVLLQDFTDRANAYAIAVPRNRIFIDVAPWDEPYETVSSGDWFTWTALHEPTHLAMIDRASTTDARYRALFHGKVEIDPSHPETLLYNYLTVPRETAPRWYHEGGAVFMETWMSGGVGRAQGGYDEMAFRAMVHDNATFYDPLALVSEGTQVDFKAGANAYLYGTRFMDYLALNYGPRSLLDWYRRDDNSRRYYADDFQRVFGLPLDVSWQQWIDWEHAFQRQNLQAVDAYPLTEYHDLARQDLGAVSRCFVSADGTRLYAAVRYPGQLAHLVAINRSNGTVTTLREVTHASGYTVTSLAYDPASDTLFYSTNNASHRDLIAYEPKSGRTRLLLQQARIGDLVYNQADRSLWGLRLNGGFVMLVRIPYPYTEWKTLYVFPARQTAFDLDLSADGTLAAMSVSQPGPKPGSPEVTSVWVVPTDAIMKGSVTPLHTLRMGSSVPESFVFSKDGRYLYGSSYFTGVSNIFRYELATEKLDAVSNAEVGFFRPLPLDGSELIVLRYTAKGFMPSQISARPTEDLGTISFLGTQVATRHPELRDWTASTPASIPYEQQVVGKGQYQPLRELSLQSIIPMVQGFKNSVAAGANARFGDPLGFDSAFMEASYSPDDKLPSRQRTHISAGVHHARWSAGAAWNGADFYDLFGPTKRSLPGYNGYVGYNLPLDFAPPRTAEFAANVAYYGDLDTLPGAQNVTSPSSHLFKASAGFVGSDLRSSPGAVDDEAGQSWAISADGNRGSGSFIPSLTGSFDFGIPLRLDHSSVWLRTGAAISSGARSDPLSNFYLGGFGNNYVDSGDNGIAQRYRDLTSMPGFDIDALNGKSLLKGVVEWCLPPIRFAALGSPGFYASWARPELFVGGLVTDPNNSDYRQSSSDVGFQLDFQLQTMHRLPMMISFGVARGFGGGGLGRTEFMASFQVL